MTNAERITKELLHEQASIWFINDEFGAKMMVKLTSTVIKEIMKGCTLKLDIKEVNKRYKYLRLIMRCLIDC